MIAISMSRLAGQSTFNFGLRVIGTAIVSFIVHGACCEHSLTKSHFNRQW
jgi:hypothetical protein